MEKPHLQNHNVNLGMIIKNIILGGQDGLVNVLGIVLGVATATASTEIVLLSGLAATFAESVSMAAVAYTSTKAEEEHYESELKKETREIEETPDEAREEIRRIYIDKGFSGELLEKVVNQITKNKEVWLKTMMKDELGLQNPKEEMSALNQGILVGISAFIGSLVPLTPFIFMNVNDAFYMSLGVSLLTLFAVGGYKSKITSGKWLIGGIEMMIIGGAAALAGYLVGVAFNVVV